MGSVVTKPMEWIGTVLYGAGESVFNAIFGDKTSSRALPSPQDVLFPPISQVLISNGCTQVIDNLKNCLKYKNTKAIEHTGTLLSDRGLDNITAAFKKAVEEDMICERCEKEIKFIDELCYCPEESDEKCHHGTSCCDNRKIKALTSGR
ncbi:hypothetical protein GPALN_014480 [Globodera pallida]|uniref:DDHD domain-containing protein n=1 Tax=Globodera pallida TaxID=36090 RepID=A0A183C6F7_GLOPA|nr:hypothetical protein GPALN_014480 [Globodera pallida]